MLALPLNAVVPVSPNWVWQIDHWSYTGTANPPPPPPPLPAPPKIG
ncbi:MAG: hypothetical protein GQ534_08965 [Candidatus Delongbacteria bacterium]|nr:hypothetical protein [Candidatus Delongbacteria bacterium]